MKKRQAVMKHMGAIRLLIGVWLWIGVAFAADSPRYVQNSRQVTEVREAAFPRPTAGPGSSTTAPRSQRFSTPVGARTGGPPGTIVGYTYADFQHVASTGRQIDERGGVIQVAFMDWPEPDGNSATMRWNRTEVAGSPVPFTLDNGETISVLPLEAPLTQEGTLLPGTVPWYANLRYLPDGRGVVLYSCGATLWRPQAAVEIAAGTGTFVLNPAPIPPARDFLDRPHGTVAVSCGDTMIHLIADADPPASELWYVGGTVSGVTVAWDPPVVMDTTSPAAGHGLYSAVMEANGDSVVLVYTKELDRGQGTDDRGVFYRLSTDCGDTWSPRIGVTDYPLDGQERAWRDLDAAFDEDGILHIIWHTNTAVPSVPGLFWYPPGHLNHWNSQRGTIRRITTADWSNRVPDGCSYAHNNGMGSFFHTLAMMNVSVKPAGAGPGGGIADRLLYAVWVQGGPVDTLPVGDCATQDSAGTPGGIVNAELYMSVSSDGGLTWDRPQNLTGTRTPNCLPGDCHSEHWVTAAARADSGVYISFVDDTHAGAFPDPFFPWHGEWSESPYMVMAVEAREPVAAAIIEVLPPADLMELNAKTYRTDTLEMAIGNLGNIALNFQIEVTNDDGGASQVQINGGAAYSGSVTEGGAPEIVTVTYDGVGLPEPSEHNWRLEITSNDSLNNPSVGGTAIDVLFNVFVADTWYTCAQDTISTGEHRLSVGSCLKLGDRENGGGLFSYAQDDEWLYDASPVLARLDGSTKRVYRDIYWNNTSDRSRDSNKAFRAQSEITIVRDTTVISGDSAYTADVATGVASSTDSLFQIDWEAIAVKEPQLSRGAVMRYTLTNRVDSTFTGLMLGAAADFDVDSLATWNDGIASEHRQYVGVQGGYGNPDIGGASFIPQPNYAALFYIPLDDLCSDVAVGGQVLDNADYVYPNAAYNTDSVYDVMARVFDWDDATLHIDTISDINVVMVDRQGAALGPDDTLRFAFGFAVSHISLGDLEQTIQNLRAAFNPSCSTCPIVMTGDVNVNGTITSSDIIYAVNYVFKGGVTPQPCEAAGDVNCNGNVTSADIIYLVNYVFKGGAPPCDGCSSPLAGDC